MLHVLRDRLTPEEAADLAAQLPLLVKGVYHDAWKPGAAPVKRDREALLQAVRERLEQGIPNEDPERVTRAVFALLDRHVSRGQIEHVVHMLPEDMRALWPERASAGA